LCLVVCVCGSVRLSASLAVRVCVGCLVVHLLMGAGLAWLGLAAVGVGPMIEYRVFSRNQYQSDRAGQGAIFTNGIEQDRGQILPIGWRATGGLQGETILREIIKPSLRKAIAEQAGWRQPCWREPSVRKHRKHRGDGHIQESGHMFWSGFRGGDRCSCTRQIFVTGYNMSPSGSR